MDVFGIDGQHGRRLFAAAVSAFPGGIQFSSKTPPVQNAADGVLIVQLHADALQNGCVAAVSV